MKCDAEHLCGDCSSGTLPKTGAIRRIEGRSTGYFRHHHASQADIPHVAVDNNLVLNVHTQFSSIKHLYYKPISWRNENICSFLAITLLKASVSGQQDHEKHNCMN
jgi:hypothetical protein